MELTIIHDMAHEDHPKWAQKLREYILATQAAAAAKEATPAEKAAAIEASKSNVQDNGKGKGKEKEVEAEANPGLKSILKKLSAGGAHGGEVDASAEDSDDESRRSDQEIAYDPHPFEPGHEGETGFKSRYGVGGSKVFLVDKVPVIFLENDEMMPESMVRLAC
ncbi:MAG: hypothetical protein ACRYGR_06665, partial [Janthinobacterium lividum]